MSRISKHEDKGKNGCWIVSEGEFVFLFLLDNRRPIRFDLFSYAFLIFTLKIISNSDTILHYCFPML